MKPLINEFSGKGDAEDTLRLIASLPAPDGLADRVQLSLRNTPKSGRLLAWPIALGGYGNALRSVAAAAIVCVVVGGGWRIYSAVQPHASARVLVMPIARPANSFSIGASVHTPDPRVGSHEPDAGTTGTEIGPLVKPQPIPAPRAPRDKDKVSKPANGAPTDLHR